MKISELITALEKLKSEHGNLNCFCAGHPGERGMEITEDSLFKVDDCPGAEGKEVGILFVF